MAAERSDAGRFIVHADRVLTAFIELQAAIHRQLGLKYWETIADNLIKAGSVGVASQRLILTGERSGLQTHIATTESVSLCTRMNC